VIFIHFIGANTFFGMYVADNGLFTELFCENRFKPELHCHGSCAITKLMEYEENDALKSSAPHLPVPQFYSYLHQFSQQKDFDLNEIPAHNFRYLQLNLKPSVTEIDHPPALV